MPASICYMKRAAATPGELGKLQFIQASHQQDMDGWPNYWPGLPPMHYATHCVGPVAAALPEARRSMSSCFGSGTIREELIKHYNSPFAVETAHVEVAKSDLSVRIIRSLLRHRAPVSAKASMFTAARSPSSGR